MKPETLILANTINKKIEAIEELIKQLYEKDVEYINFSERFSDNSICLDANDEDDANDIQAIMSAYIDILSKKLLKLQEELDKL